MNRFAYWQLCNIPWAFQHEKECQLITDGGERKISKSQVQWRNSADLSRISFKSQEWFEASRDLFHDDWPDLIAVFPLDVWGFSGWRVSSQFCCRDSWHGCQIGFFFGILAILSDFSFSFSKTFIFYKLFPLGFLRIIIIINMIVWCLFLLYFVGGNSWDFPWDFKGFQRISKILFCFVCVCVCVWTIYRWSSDCGVIFQTWPIRWKNNKWVMRNDQRIIG